MIGGFRSVLCVSVSFVVIVMIDIVRSLNSKFSRTRYTADTSIKITRLFPSLLLNIFLRGSTRIFACNLNNFSQNKSMFKLSGAVSDAMLLWCFHVGTKCSAS